MTKNLLNPYTLLIAMLVFLGACSDSDSDPTLMEGEQSIARTFEIDQQYSTLLNALESSGLLSTFEGDGPFTIFAPNDAAFAKLPDGTLDELTADQLSEVLRYHVISGSAIASSQLQSTQDVGSLLGEDLLVESANGVTVNNFATVTTADYMTTNGIIHTIDEVLLPAGIREANIVDQANNLGTFTTLVGAVSDAGLASTLKFKGDFTVFAPTDDAFSELPSGLLANLTTEQLAEILTYHVLDGEVFASALDAENTVTSLSTEDLFVTKDENGTVTANGSAEVVTADVDVSNGVIHAIDQVLLPDAYGTVVDAASKRFIFSTLVQYIIDAQLVTALSDQSKSYTVFAPTNGAFDNLSDNLVNSLTAEDLVNILNYHVVESEITSDQLEPTQDVETINGEDIFIEVDGTATVNGYANIVATDVQTNNGVIHVIDEVLLPAGYRDANIIDQANTLGSFTTLVGAIESAGLTSTLKYSGDYTVFAPTDAAFAALPDGLLDDLTTEQLTNILTYHVIGSEIFSADLGDTQSPDALSGEALYVTKSGMDVAVNGTSDVVTADVDVSNGVIHAVDEVLLPNAFLDITQIASKNYDLSTLVSLLDDNDLVSTLQGDGPFTVFAPTNTAFADAASVLDELTSEQVAEVLTYHVVTSKALSGDLSDGQVIPSFQGENITVAIDGEGNVTLNGSVNVTTVDLEGTNGVIHIIDAVILPPSYQN